jgi:hypothetical protein
MIRLPVFLSSILITFLCWLYLVPTVRRIHIPYRETFGIISEGVVAGRSPLSNIVMYLILLIVPGVIVFLLNFVASKKVFRKTVLEKSNQFFDRVSSWMETISKRIQTSRFSRTLPLIWVFVVALWITNRYDVKSLPRIQAAVQDGFHFGEKVGLGQTFLKDPQHFFENGYLLIHGFTLNVLPGALGILLFGTDRDLAATVILNDTLFYVIPAIFSFLIVFEIATYISERHRWQVFFVLSLIYFAWGNGAIFRMISRDVVFLPQAYLAIRWVRLLSRSTDRILGRQHLIYATLIGAVVPLGIIGVNDRAVYFTVATMILFAWIWAVKGFQNFLKLAAMAIAGFALSSLLISSILGWNAIPLSIANILYWSKAGMVFTSLPYPAVKFSRIAPWAIIFFQSLAVSILLLKLWHQPPTQSNKLVSFLRENGVALFVLLLAIFYMRVALTKSDMGHIIPCGFLALFALVATIGRDYVNYLLQPGHLNHRRSRWFYLLVLPLFLICVLNLNAIAPALRLTGIADNFNKLRAVGTYENSQVMNPRYVEAVNQLEPEVQQQSCFYTLTSEGIWYRMFSLPPCSRYWYFIQAAKPQMQQQLIDELEVKKPRILLYSNPKDGIQDNVPKESARLLAHQYVWQAYQPYKLIEDNWFWVRRAQKPDEFKELLVSNSAIASGSFASLETQGKRDLEVVATGILPAPLAQAPTEAVVLLTYNPVEQPDEIMALALDRATERANQRAKDADDAKIEPPSDEWQLSFNRLNLPRQEVRIRAWAYNPQDQKFYEFAQSTVQTIEGKSKYL